MRWPMKVIVFLCLLLLVGGIVFFGYLVKARQQSNEYQFQIEAILSAATVANQGEVTESPDTAVIAEYNGVKAVIHPENYRQLSFYLREDCAMPPFGDVDLPNAIKVTFCGTDQLWAAPKDNSGDRIRIRLETGGRTYRMHARGGGLWDKLIACCTKGTYLADNLLIDN